jgi:hypothetical protein
MATPAVVDLETALTDPEVAAALEVLGRHGLGATVIHSHDNTSDAMAPLPTGTVQFEDNLVVSFVPEDDPRLAGSVAVSAAHIDGVTRIVGRCMQGHEIWR